MKIRGSGGKGTKIEAQMAPMIDVVFQLLIFFMLTLKIIEPEGDFDVNIPMANAAQAAAPQIQAPIKVRLEADPFGELESLWLGSIDYMKDNRSVDAAFEGLNLAIWRLVKINPLREEMEVEIDADFHLKYEYVVRAIGACRGRAERDRQGRMQVIPYIERIKFAPQRQPAAGA